VLDRIVEPHVAGIDAGVHRVAVHSKERRVVAGGRVFRGLHVNTRSYGRPRRAIGEADDAVRAIRARVIKVGTS
jgi:hypothetical protein